MSITTPPYTAPVELRVYLRQYCHLCHDLLSCLREFETGFILHIQIIDIDNDPQLETKYGEWIPVLTDKHDQEICHYFFDAQALTAYLEKIR